MSLLEVARGARRKRKVPSREMVELAVAFFSCDLTSVQVRAALAAATGSERTDQAVYQVMAATLRNAVGNGLVSIKAAQP